MLPRDATEGVALSHTVPVAFNVRSLVLPSLYVPVAMNAVPFGTTNDGFRGVIAMLTRTGGGGSGTKQVNTVVPVTVPEVAEIVLVPAIRQFTNC